MKRIMASLVLAVALTGCQGNLPLTPGGTAGTGLTQTSPLRLGSLEFKPVSAETARQMAQQASGGATAAAAPMAAPAPERAGVADAKMASPYYYGSYFGGPFGNMKLDSVSEANAPGSKGGWREVQAQVIAPVVADWSADARLVNTNGALSIDGALIEGQETYPGENAWHASYASIARNEVLEFHVSPAGTRVVRMSWKPVSLDIASLAVDPKDAITKLKAAIIDRAFKSKEEQLGHDYFFNGQEGGTGVGIAVPAIAVKTAPAPDMAVSTPAAPPSAPNVSSGSASSPTIAIGEPTPYTPPKEEPVYELPAGGRWNVNLEAIGDYTVWSLNYSPAQQNYVERKPGETFVDGYAYGMVDAKSGEVIRLRRPMRITIPTGPIARPMPMPAETKPVQ